MYFHSKFLFSVFLITSADNVIIYTRIRRDDIEDEDDHESYFNYVKNAPVVAYPDDEEEIEYDSDGNPIAPEKSKVLKYVL